VRPPRRRSDAGLGDEVVGHGISSDASEVADVVGHGVPSSSPEPLDLGGEGFLDDPYPALAALRERGVHIGVISDWGSNLGTILDGLGLGRHLDFVLASGSVGLAKPDPALFRMALERAGGVQVKAAELLGMSFRSFRYYVKKYNLR